MKVYKTIIAVLILTGIVTVIGCRRNIESGRLAPAAGANVVIFLVDALRADRLEPNTMPHMTELAGKGARFTTAVTQAPWTSPSVASLFTSLYTPAHGLKTPKVDGVDISLSVLSEKFDTLAEIFNIAGYSTAAFVPNTFLIGEFGFNQGFDVFRNMPYKTSVETLHETALQWLESLDRREPFFIYLHYMDVHGPYDTPDSYDGRFADRYESQMLTREQFDKLKTLSKGTYEDDAARDLKTYKEAYDANAAYVDEAIHNFIKKLEKYSPTEKTIFVFLSDHGEGFFEHGFPDHGYTLHDEEIIVPLFFVAKGALPGGKVFDEQVELVDVFPTLSSLAGVGKPRYPVSGISLTGAMLGTDKLSPDRIVGSTCYMRGPRRAAIRVPGLKMIWSFDPPNSMQIYDLTNDPGEKNNLADTRADLVERAIKLFEQSTMNAMKTGLPDIEEDRKTLDPEKVKELKSLGYLE